MFASEFGGGCGLASWGSNSQIVHAVASSPEGPYTKVGVAVPRWAHNPAVARTADGNYHIWHIGGTGAPPPNMLNCSTTKGHDGRDTAHGTANSTVRASARAVRGPSRGTTTAIVGADTQRSSRARGANPTRAPTTAPTHYPGWCRAGTISCNSSHVVHTSASLDGPWTPTTTWVHINAGHLSNENPTPLVLDNGTIMLLINTYMGNACETIAVSEFGWEGPYSVPLWRNNTNGTLEGHAEDGYLYRDVRGHWHALFHFFPKIGGHAFSIDGVAWSNVTYAYNGTIQLAPTSPNNNATVECARRERPSLIFDDKGAPTHLVTGCCVAPCNMSQPHGPGGYSFTSVQPLNTA
jgi:hypothetical protein